MDTDPETRAERVTPRAALCRDGGAPDDFLSAFLSSEPNSREPIREPPS